LALATTKGKKFAEEALAERRRIYAGVENTNGNLPVGSDITVRCISCNAVADVLPEKYVREPREFCVECDAIRRMGWSLE